MSSTPEGKEKDKVKQYLSSIGAYHFWPVPGGYGKQTIDCLACIPRYRLGNGVVYGLFAGIEVKAPGKKATARQAATLNEIDTANGLTVTGTGDEIVEFLSRYAC